MSTRSYTYSHFDTDDAPTPGGGSISTATSGWLLTNAWVTDQVVSTDLTGTASRTSDDIEIQVDFASIDSASPAGGIGIVLADGAYAIGLSIGTSLAWVDPSDMTTEIAWDWPASAFPWQARHVVRLRKVGSGRWTLHIDGAPIAEAPYLLAIADDQPAYYRIGLLPGASSGTCTVTSFEVGCNVCVAPIEDVERYRLGLPAGIRANWNSIARGRAVAMIGAVRRSYLMHEEAPKLRGCDRIRLDASTLSSDTLDGVEWTQGADLDVEGVRNRLRLSTAVSGFASYAWPTTAPAQVERVVSGTFVLRGAPSVGADGDTGFTILLDDATRLIAAGLYRFGTAGYGWRFGYTSTKPGNDPRPVRADVPHKVELRATTDHALLVVNGAVVDRMPYSSFGASPGTYDDTAAVGWQRAPGSDVYVDVEGITATRYLSDLSSRPHLRQVAAEKTMFASGAERADELRAWLDRRAATMRLRGTTAGIRAEARRMGASAHAFVSEESTPAMWVLDVTFPDVTPIWLDLDGSILDIYVEAGNLGPNWSAGRLCELLAAYLTPVSVLERRYHVCITTPLTATATAGSSVALAVSSTRGFAVGQDVSVVNYDRSSRSDGTVTAVGATTVTIDELDATFTHVVATPNYLRCELADTMTLR